MIRFKQKGDLKKTYKFLNNAKNSINYKILDQYGFDGVQALKRVTPVDSGLTAKSWKYEIVKNKDSVSLMFTNTNIQNGVPIAIILQYGHATRNGGYVEGRDYINPAIQPIFDDLAKKMWKEITEI